jgi:flagellar hook-length control protein FliK
MTMRRTALALMVTAALAAAACSPGPTPSPAPATPAAATATPSEAVVSPSAPPSALESASPSDALASPAASASTAALPVCISANLAATVTGWQGAMGSQIASVKLVNTSALACLLQGTPQLQLVDAAGHTLLDSSTAGESGLPRVSPGDRAWTIAPADWVTTMVQTSNYCGSVTPVTPTTIAMILPSGGGRLVAAADPRGGVPGCNGSPGDVGVIAMNGWAH